VAAGLGLAAVALSAAACDPAIRTASETLRAYYEAVQEQDYASLYCLMAGASRAAELGATDAERRAGFAAWAQAYTEAYETGRNEGRVELDEQGLALVRMFALGRGAYATQEHARKDGPDAMVVETKVRFGYAHVDLSPLSPGTTFYVCGAPVGRMHAVRVPKGSREVSVDALDTVTVVWTLVRSPAREGCPAGWTVASGQPLPGSATTTEITWVF